MFTTQTHSVSYGTNDFGGVVFFAFLVFAVIALLACVLPFWRIFRKAGFPGALSLLMLAPGVNLVLLYILAFAEWPALRKKRDEVI